MVEGRKIKPTMPAGIVVRPMIEQQEIQFMKYFEKVKSRNMYYVQMKAIIAKSMRKRGFTLGEIGTVLNSSHSVVVHYLSHQKSNSDTYEYVNENYIQWIERKQYPVTRRYSKNNLTYCRLVEMNT